MPIISDFPRDSVSHSELNNALTSKMDVVHGGDVGYVLTKNDNMEDEWLPAKGGFYPVIDVSAPTGATLSCVSTDGTEVDGEEGDGVIRYKIPDYGTYTVTAITSVKTESVSVVVDEIKQYKVSVGFIKRYGIRIAKNDSNPATRVTYLYDAEGMTPAKMDFSAGKFDYGSWADIWFVKDNKPLMLKSNGQVDYYLNPNDYTKKEDGTTSDVANTAYDGNAMAQFPLCWVYRYEDESYEYEIVADSQYDENYKAYAHTRADGSIAAYFYWSMFGGSSISDKIRSISGQALAQSQNTETQITQAKANNKDGSSWFIHVWSQRSLIQTLLTLIGRSTDTQAVFGNGNCRSASNASGLLATGTLNTSGQFWGTTANSTSQVKVFHIEQFWGNQWDRTAGVINNSGPIYVKMTPEGSGYQITSVTGYTNTGVTLSGTSGGYISATQCSPLGRIPKTISGSATTYECDGSWFNNGQLDYLIAGASAAIASGIGGAFTFDVNNAPSGAVWHVGCGLSCEMPAA